MTVGNWLDIWLKDYTGNKKYLTVKHYQAQCRTHIKPALGGVKLKALTAPMIQNFYNDLWMMLRLQIFIMLLQKMSTASFFG